jgi:hypothetical protein
MGLASFDLQQLYAQLLLQLGDGIADRRLAEMKEPGRFGEAATVDHRVEDAPLLQTHMEIAHVVGARSVHGSRRARRGGLFQ